MNKPLRTTLSVVVGVLLSALIAIGITYGVSVWNEHNHTSEQAAQSTEKPKTKYDIGPPDPQEMLELVNEERRKVGVEPLTIDENVQISAQLKADHMAEHDYFQHNIPGTEYTLTREMADYVNKSCSRSGENITDNLTDEENTTYRAMFNFIHSKPHYEALVNPEYTKVGFGVAGTKVVQHLCVPL